MLGLWIDGLTDEKRDRIVVLPLDRWWDGGRGEMCLVSCAYDLWSLGRAVEIEPDVAFRYDRLCTRFGLDRTVRAIKLRAGAKVEIGEHTPEHVGHVK